MLYIHITTKELKMDRPIPGTPEWEDICARCGLCCLVKYVDKLGSVYLTNIRCDMLNLNGTCKCYSADVAERESSCGGCVENGGSPLNYETLSNSYVVPGFCAYVQKFGAPKLVKKCAKRPEIKLEDTVPESEVPADKHAEHIIVGSKKYFKYNPHVNKAIHDAYKVLSK